jgi:hypothetical protein
MMYGIQSGEPFVFVLGANGKFHIHETYGVLLNPKCPEYSNINQVKTAARVAMEAICEDCRDMFWPILFNASFEEN